MRQFEPADPALIAGWRFHLPEALRSLNEFLFEKLAAHRDHVELAALAEEIEAKLQEGAGGVLIKRLTRRIADTAGNFIPEYIGLQAVWTGNSEAEAKAAYEAAKRKAWDHSPENLLTVCTPTNPTGRSEKAQALLRAAPKGFNIGYAAALSAKISKIHEDNPSNIGPIEVKGHALPIQPKSYLEETLFFVSKRNWIEWSASRER